VCDQGNLCRRKRSISCGLMKNPQGAIYSARRFAFSMCGSPVRIRASRESDEPAHSRDSFGPKGVRPRQLMSQKSLHKLRPHEESSGGNF
jgi:hypothetical protein